MVVSAYVLVEMKGERPDRKEEAVLMRADNDGAGNSKEARRGRVAAERKA